MSESAPTRHASDAPSQAQRAKPVPVTEPTNPELEAILNLFDGALAPHAEPSLREYAWAYWVHYVPVIRILVRSMPARATDLTAQLPPRAQLATIVEQIGGALVPDADRRVRAHGWQLWRELVPALRTLVRSSALPLIDPP